MNIRRVDAFEDLERLKACWRDVHSKDPEATVFQSWGWISGWLRATPDPWFVLVLEPIEVSAPVAFWAFYEHRREEGAAFMRETEIRFAGSPLADYEGFLCLPGYEESAGLAVRRYLSAHFHRCRIGLYAVADPRVVRWAMGFDTRYHLVHSKRGLPCPRVSLPATWEEYLADTVRTSFAKRLRSALKKAANFGCLIETGSGETTREHISVFLRFMERRWGELSSMRRDQFIGTLTGAFEEGLLETTVLSLDELIIGVHVSFADRNRGIYHYYNGGRHPEMGHLSPGTVLNGFCIKKAIEEGYRTYDFMRGGEAYKYDYGAVDGFNYIVTIDSRHPLARIRRSLSNGYTSATKKASNLRRHLGR